jgi:hypothetical protein
MKTIPVFLLLIALSAFAQTNEPVIGVLPAGGVSYTNARITRITPAYAVVSYEGGIVQLALSNLPVAYQKKYGYDPDKAAQYLADEKQKAQERRAALVARQAAYNQAMAALAGTNRPVQLLSILDEQSNGGIPLCATPDVPDGVLVKNLPDPVRSFLKQKQQLAADVNAFSDQLQADAAAAARAQAVAPAYSSTDPDVNDAQNRQRAQANLMAMRVKDNQAELARMKKTLDDLDAEAPGRATIMAFPTGQFFGGFEIWTCVGMP